jgi:hypothetical protein
MAGAVGASAAANLLLLALPLVIIAGNALFVRNCSMAEGTAFFMLLAPVSALFGVSLGFFCAVHFAHPRTLFLLLCFVLLAYSAGLGYFTPAVFSYNFLYGYFPGLTYDEVILVTRTLVLFRLLTLFVAAVLLWAGMITVTDSRTTGISRRRFSILGAGLVSRDRRIRAAAIACTLAGFYLFRCDLGFESTAAYIQRSLGAEIRTEHFVLYYSPSSFTAGKSGRLPGNTNSDSARSFLRFRSRTMYTLNRTSIPRLRPSSALLGRGIRTLRNRGAGRSTYPANRSKVH